MSKHVMNLIDLNKTTRICDFIKAPKTSLVLLIWLKACKMLLSLKNLL